MNEMFVSREQRAEYKKKILQEFKSVINFYRLESSEDLLELFNTFGWLLVCGGICGNDPQELLRTDHAVIQFEENLRRIQQCLGEKEREHWHVILHNNQILARAVEEISSYEGSGGITDSVWKQILNVLQSLLEKYREVCDPEFLYETVRDIFDLCANTRSDRNRYMLPDQIVYQVAKLIQSEQTNSITEQNGWLFDPQYGSGNMLLAAGTYLKEAHLCGYEQNETLRMSAQILSVLSNRAIETHKGDFLEDREAGMFDIVLANPPFHNENVPDHEREWFLPGELGRVRGRHNLFLIRSLQVLAENGHAVLVVPDSFLFSSKTETMLVRRWMLENYCVEGISSLPPKTFYPNTAVRASILILSKPFMQVGWMSGRTPFLFFYELNVDADSEEMGAELSDVWNQREYYFRQWQNQLDYSNLGNVPTAENWEHKTFWFADPETVEKEKWNMQPGHYQPEERQELQVENPQALLEKLMREQEELLEEMQRLAREVGRL